MGLVYNTAWKLPTVPHRVGRTRTEDGQAMRGQGGIFRRGQVWWIRYHRGGQEYRESARTADREIAIRLLHSRLAELPVKGLPQPETVTFEDLAQGYLQARIVNGVKGGHLLWPRARVANLSTVLAGMRAVDITTAGMREYAQGRLASGAAPGTVNRDFGVLRRMMILAVQAGRLTRRPHVPRQPTGCLRPLRCRWPGGRGAGPSGTCPHRWRCPGRRRSALGSTLPPAARPAGLLWAALEPPLGGKSEKSRLC
jgi:hypothetical protein